MSVAELDQVATLYDSPEGQLGPILFGGHLHWGYWESSSSGETFAEAAEKLSQIMIGKTRIGAGERFVDLGCGVGQPAVRLTEARGCFVDGITISGFQQRSATERAAASGLSDRLRFLHGSALDVPSADATYDGGWFFESIFHMGHRAALAEAGRILKPGATLVLTDLPTLPGVTTDKFLAFVDEHIHSSFVSKEDYPALLAEAGFELVELEDVTAHVMPQLVPKLKDAVAEHRAKIDATLGAAAEEQIENWIFLFEYMAENLGYILVTARKL